MSLFDFTDLIALTRPPAPRAAPMAHAAPASFPRYAPTAATAAAAARSPTAATIVDDERETYMARSAAFDKKRANDHTFQRAMARARGEEVDELPITPELGAPKQSRPLRDPQAVIAEALAEKRPAAPPAAAAAPESSKGPSARDLYMSNRAALDEKAAKMPFYQQAMERYAKKKAG